MALQKGYYIFYDFPRKLQSILCEWHNKKGTTVLFYDLARKLQ